MSEFNNVTITREANVYFDGNVTSRAVKFADGSSKTLGIMMPGEYTFGTAKPELMEILAGELSYRLEGTDEWLTVKGGESFNVPGDSSFDLKVSQLADYCCSYID
ncbi:MAG: pyrimidine/purine nucleoside phosphorylase [Gammaproteobacteria bacterium]|nr:pyrimidine/purine nucleoside phosphorylase [Gammaproteobacteria bacterium]